MNIECKNVTLGYENRIVAKNVNFSINQGDYLCIVGENGTGKSTLIKTLLGLISPLQGKISINAEKRYRISSTANPGTKGLSGKCVGGCVVRSAKHKA